MEYVPFCAASDPPEFAIDSIFEIEQLKKRYRLHGTTKVKLMVQSLRQSLQGQYSEKLEDLAADVNLSNAVNQANNNQTKWNNLMQDFCKSIFPCGALEDQKDYLEETKCPGDLSLDAYVKRVVTINKRLKYYERNANAFSIRQLSQKVISKTLGEHFEANMHLK